MTYMQFMEDTFATASSFRSGGTWKFQSDPRNLTSEVADGSSQHGGVTFGNLPRVVPTPLFQERH